MNGPDLSVFELRRLVDAAREQSTSTRHSIENLKVLEDWPEQLRAQARERMVEGAIRQSTVEARAWAEAACVFLWVVLR